MGFNLANILQFLAAPLRLFFFASAVGALSKNRELLLTIGFLPLFSLLDVGIQSASRWRAVVGAVVVIPLLSRFAGGALLLSSYVFAAKFGGARYYILFICVAYAVNSMYWRYESAFAGKALASLVSVLEIAIGSVALLLLFRGAGEGVATLLICTFPVSRVLALGAVGGGKGGVIPRKSSLSLRNYILLNLLPQLTAALASSLPSFMQLFMHDHSDFSSVLVTVKFLHSSSAMLSLFVNIYASRIFYGTMGEGWVKIQNRLLLAVDISYKYCALFFLLVVPTFFFDVSSVLGRIALVIFSVPLLATSNLVSSLALANNLPEGATSSQLVVFLATATVCAILYQSVFLAIFSISVLAATYLKYQVHIPKMLIYKNEEEIDLAH